MVLAGVPGKEATGRVSDQARDSEAGREPGGSAVPEAGPEGLAWSWELDLETVLAAVAKDTARRKATRRPVPASLDGGNLAGVVAEHLPPGPDLAGWLALTDPGGLENYALAGVASSWRRLASWATAGELATVGQMTARAAARDAKVGLADDGRPVRVSAEAATEIALAETFSPGAATWWAQLAVSLSWRLPAVGTALWAGQIDLSRARKIAEATDVLPEDKARQVADSVLSEAGELTLGELGARLRRAVIAADPEGADERRNESEAHAKVVLRPDDDGTATMAGYNLPAVQAAAAMARITALARACKAAGQGGGIDLLRAQVMLGLLLGTLGYIPPADCAPDQPPPADDASPDGPPPGNDDPGPGDGGPDGSGPGAPAGGSADDNVPAAGDDVPADDVPVPGDEHAPADDGMDDLDDPMPDDPDALAGYADDGLDDGGIVPAWPCLPPVIGPVGGSIPPAFARRQAERPDRPVPGLLDLAVPYRTLAGLAGLPGRVGRIGPVTPAIASHLATVAAGDLAATWRVIVTDANGHAIAVARIRRPRRMRGSGGSGPGPPARAGPPGTGGAGIGGAGLVGRVTLTISREALIRPPPAVNGGRSNSADGADSALGQPEIGRPGTGPSDGLLGAMLVAAKRAAARAAERADRVTAADKAAGGCAHLGSSPHYRPPPRLREYVVARDATCRAPTCRQPAWQSDLDHTVPWDKGHRTCKCNLGGGCRTHHQVKQRPGWQLTQHRPGYFEWVTPAGRVYATGPDTHPRLTRLPPAACDRRAAAETGRPSVKGGVGHGLGQPASALAGVRAAVVVA